MKQRTWLIAAIAAFLVLAVWVAASRQRPATPPAQPNPASAATAPTDADLTSIVTNFRKLIVLVEGEADLDPATRDRVPVIGKVIFLQNREQLEALTARLTAREARSEEIARFLGTLENDPGLRDADKLALIDVVEALAESLPERPGEAQAALAKRAATDLASLREIQIRYSKELERVLARLDTRSMTVTRESWDAYVRHVRSLHTPQAVLEEFAGLVPPAVAETRGKSATSEFAEINGQELPPKTVVLTFDDGPHHRFTDRIVAILAQYGAPQSVFFEVGRNVGEVGADGTVKLGKNAAISRRITDAGHLLANHSYTHPVLTKLAAEAYTAELANTNRLLAAASPAGSAMFRPPYGERNAAILDQAQRDGMRSVMWNVDSLDWADPIPASIATRVLNVLDKSGRGIILFHDIQGRTVEALPLVLEGLKARGFGFATWDGKRFRIAAAGTETAPAPKPMPEPPARALYRESWAVVIGIDDYAKWPKLRYAVNDATGMRDLLVSRYRFKPENVFTLTNGAATREAILSLLGDKLGNAELIKPDDRVFVFFAGHGATRRLPSGRDLGYIVPVDADTSNFQGQAISMTQFQDIAEAIPAKHVLFVMDSCYSGLALTRGGAQNYVTELARRPARQMMTAGGADQEVADGGPNGHSVFTWTLLQALDGKGDLNADGYITASELGAYVAPVVSSLSRQTPAFGNLAGSAGGDFVFELKHEAEFLTAESTQLGDAAIRLNTEIERLKAENEKLKGELAAAKTPAGKTPIPEGAAGRNDRGIRLFREKRLDEALTEFLAAAQAESTNAQFANNVGFAYFKLGKLEDAVKWFERTIQLDPRRAVAYLNLGDALAQLGRQDAAKTAFAEYLRLQPAGSRAAELRALMSAGR